MNMIQTNELFDLQYSYIRILHNCNLIHRLIIKHTLDSFIYNTMSYS